MDNLTHTLTGLILSRAGLNRLHPKAHWILMLAANAPDVDIVTAVAGAQTYFALHRGPTHALLFMPLVALLPVLIVRLLRRKESFSWARAFLLSMIGIGSHLLLDLTNAYGIRLFLPFSDAWPALDITNVIDPWIWTALIGAAVWPLLSRLVSSEIGGRPASGSGLAKAALCFILLYDVTRWFLHRQAVLLQQDVLYNGQQARRVIAMATAASPFRWKGIVETNSSWVLQDVQIGREPDPGAARILYKPETSEAIEAARRTDAFQILGGFSRTFSLRATPTSDPDEGSIRVEGVDLRFGFTAEAVVDRTGQVRDSSFHF